MNNYDVVIIGGGPSAITCAVYLKRFGLNPVIIKKDYGALEKATIDNYYGFTSIDGKDLHDIGINQARNLDIDVFEDEVVSIENFNDFVVKTPNNEFSSKAVYISTGKARKKINALNLENFESKGISYCAICDGFFYKKKKLAIIGAGNYMLNELEVLEKFSDDITIFTNGEEFVNATKYNVVTEKIVSFDGFEYLESIKTETSDFDIEGAFIAIGTASASDFSKHMGIVLDDKLNIVVNDDFMTNIKGVFAGGDVIGGLLQVSKAVSDGAHASMAIKQYLKSVS